MKNLVIIGAGGFAREVFDMANYCYGTDPDFKIKGFLSDGPSSIESLGYPAVLSNVADYSIEEEDVFFCGIGSVQDRKKCVEIILSKGGKFINLIHPNVVISPSVKIGIGVAIKAYCVLASDAVIGDFTFIQSAVIMGHDVQVGKYCQINSFSFFAGNSRLEDSVFVGAHSKFVQSTTAEELSVIGIGSLVIRKVKKGTTVFGSPAKKIDY
jgi:sugar O-acyltransferase (sialic acid O-acetyltransferase NeuD family)